MTFISDLADMMTDTATWRALTGRDDYGVPTYASPGTSYAARLVRKHRMVRSLEGDEVVSTAQLWIGGTPAIAADDRVTLSDGSTPVILAVERFQDEIGASHVVVFFR